MPGEGIQGLELDREKLYEIFLSGKGAGPVVVRVRADHVLFTETGGLVLAKRGAARSGDWEDDGPELPRQMHAVFALADGEWRSLSVLDPESGQNPYLDHAKEDDPARSMGPIG